MRPRLRRYCGSWVCSGGGYMAEAATPYSAYVKWKRIFDNHTYLRPQHV